MAKTCSYFSFRGSTLKLKGAFDQPRGIRATVSRNLVRQPRGAVSRLPAFTAHPASTPGPGTTSRGRSRGAVFGVGPKRTHTHWAHGGVGRGFGFTSTKTLPLLPLSSSPPPALFGGLFSRQEERQNVWEAQTPLEALPAQRTRPGGWRSRRRGTRGDEGEG